MLMVGLQSVKTMRCSSALRYDEELKWLTADSSDNAIAVTSASTLSTELLLSSHNSILPLSCPKGKRTAAEHVPSTYFTLWRCTICETHHWLAAILFHKRLNSVYYRISTVLTSILYDASLTNYVRLIFTMTLQVNEYLTWVIQKAELHVPVWQWHC